MTNTPILNNLKKPKQRVSFLEARRMLSPLSQFLRATFLLLVVTWVKAASASKKFHYEKSFSLFPHEERSQLELCL